MERLLLACLCVLGLRRRPRGALAFPGGGIGPERRSTFVNRTGGSDGCLLKSLFARLYASDLLGGCRNPGEWRAKIGQIDQRKQQTRYPKNVHMCEQRNETQDSDNIELQLVGSISPALGQGRQPNEQKDEQQEGQGRA